MKGKINVKIIKTHNYQTYSVGLNLNIDYNSDEELLGLIDKYQQICRKKCLEQMRLD